MRILVNGGTGILGRAAVPKPAGAGHVVRVLTRRRKNPTTPEVRRVSDVLRHHRVGPVGFEPTLARS
jgi:uncharacterized protein YbjT (DUF2867 family)